MKPQDQQWMLEAIRNWVKAEPTTEELLQVLQTLGTNVGASKSLAVPCEWKLGCHTVAEVVADSLSDSACWLEDSISTMTVGD